MNWIQHQLLFLRIFNLINFQTYMYSCIYLLIQLGEINIRHILKWHITYKFLYIYTHANSIAKLQTVQESSNWHCTKVFNPSTRTGNELNWQYCDGGNRIWREHNLTVCSGSFEHTFSNMTLINAMQQGSIFNS